MLLLINQQNRYNVTLEIKQLIQKKSGKEDKRQQKTGGQIESKYDGSINQNHIDEYCKCKW